MQCGPFVTGRGPTRRMCIKFTYLILGLLRKHMNNDVFPTCLFYQTAAEPQNGQFVSVKKRERS
jgi:hypothetical protein